MPYFKQNSNNDLTITQFNLSQLLIGVGVETNSPDRKLNYLYEFLQFEPTYFSDTEKQEMIARFVYARDKKSQQGTADANRQHQAKPKKTKGNDNVVWMCVESGFSDTCQKCQQIYRTGEIVFVEKATRHGYHPTCAPAEAHDDPLASSHFNRLLQKKNSK